LLNGSHRWRLRGRNQRPSVRAIGAHRHVGGELDAKYAVFHGLSGARVDGFKHDLSPDIDVISVGPKDCAIAEAYLFLEDDRFFGELPVKKKKPRKNGAQVVAPTGIEPVFAT
jgi:hypothetical protein